MISPRQRGHYQHRSPPRPTVLPRNTADIAPPPAAPASAPRTPAETLEVHRKLQRRDRNSQAVEPLVALLGPSPRGWGHSRKSQFAPRLTGLSSRRRRGGGESEVGKGRGGEGAATGNSAPAGCSATGSVLPTVARERGALRGKPVEREPASTSQKKKKKLPVTREGTGLGGQELAPASLHLYPQADFPCGASTCTGF